MSAIRQVEALVAQREIGYLLIAQRQSQAGPIEERRINDFVAGEPAVRIRHGHVADLPSPAFDERHNKVIRLQWSDRHVNGPVRQSAQLLANEGHRALDFQPAYIGSGKYVAGGPS